MPLTEDRAWPGIEPWLSGAIPCQGTYFEPHWPGPSYSFNDCWIYNDKPYFIPFIDNSFFVFIFVSLTSIASILFFPENQIFVSLIFLYFQCHWLLILWLFLSFCLLWVYFALLFLIPQGRDLDYRDLSLLQCKYLFL